MRCLQSAPPCTALTLVHRRCCRAEAVFKGGLENEEKAPYIPNPENLKGVPDMSSLIHLEEDVSGGDSAARSFGPPARAPDELCAAERIGQPGLPVRGGQDLHVHLAHSRRGQPVPKAARHVRQEGHRGVPRRRPCPPRHAAPARLRRRRIGAWPACERDAPSADPERPCLHASTAQGYQDLCATGRNQSLIVCGESGSGKTENAKFLMQYLAEATKQCACRRRLR